MTIQRARRALSSDGKSAAEEFDVSTDVFDMEAEIGRTTLRGQQLAGNPPAPKVPATRSDRLIALGAEIGSLAFSFVRDDQRRAAAAGYLPRAAPCGMARCFRWICNRQQKPIGDWHGQLRMMKNTAYAWRQGVFFASLLDEALVRAHLGFLDQHLAAQTPEFSERFGPVVVGLRRVASGETFDTNGIHHASGGRRFLG